MKAFTSVILGLICTTLKSLLPPVFEHGTYGGKLNLADIYIYLYIIYLYQRIE